MRIVISAVLLFVGALTVGAEPVLKTTAKNVAVYKNGYAFVYREGEVKPDNGRFYTDQVPAAVLGTYWAYSLDKDSRVDEVIASMVEDTTQSECLSLSDLLAANTGKNVRIRTREATFSGKLIDASHREKEIEKPAPSAETLEWRERFQWVTPLQFSSESVRRGPAPVMPSPESAPYLVLETTAGTEVVPVNQVESFSIDGDLARERTIRQRNNRLYLHLDKPRSSANVGISYLTKGIRWIPSYHIDQDKADSAHLVLDSLLINEAEDLEGATVNLVVGVPSFKFADALSPLSLRTAWEPLSAFFSESRGGGGNAFSNAWVSNAIMSQVSVPSRGERGEEGPGVLPSADVADDTLSGSGAGELFLYEREKVWLKKGESAGFVVLDARVPCETVYVYRMYANDWWDRMRSFYSRRDNNDQVRRALEAEKVWHTVRLTNNTNRPLTTGPAAITKDGNLLGQDLLAYTSLGRKVDIKTTIAVDVAAELVETEVERQENARHDWDLVKIKAELRFTNYKKEPIHLDAVREVFATRIWDLGGGGKDEKVGNYLRAYNQSHELTWDLQLQPGESVTLPHEFSLYIN